MVRARGDALHVVASVLRQRNGGGLGMAEAAQAGAGDAEAACEQFGSGQAISASVVIQSFASVGRCLAGSSGSTEASE